MKKMNLQKNVARNFRVMLAERRIKKSELSKVTGLSRNTLTTLASGNAKMIQFETIEKVAKAFDVEPYELFETKKD